MAGVACLCTAAAVYLRNVRQLRSAEQRSAELKTQLHETNFARETAEQSLSLLEAELQRKVKQLDEAQRAASAAGSPCIATPGTQGAGTLAIDTATPRLGELPPPPAHLVERFLRERNAVAVEQDQVQAWLDMEQQFSELQEALAQVQGALAQKDSQLASLDQVRDEQLAQVRAWLDEAQDQLLTTQGALQEREAECKALGEQVASLTAGSGLSGDREQLLARNLELAKQLQSASAEQDSLAQLSIAGYELAMEVSKPLADGVSGWVGALGA